MNECFPSSCTYMIFGVHQVPPSDRIYIIDKGHHGPRLLYLCLRLERRLPACRQVSGQTLEEQASE